ncbi:hypothetical protein L6R29_04745 [Myxococcota bacterium]|nr:hypothetical protein [Myxococcota bacterium]
MTRQTQPQGGNPGLIFYVLWGAMVGSGFLYALIAYILRAQMTAEQIAKRATESAAMVSLLTMTFAAASVAVGVLALFALPVLMKSAHPFMVFILRLALCESICVYGFILSMMGASLQVSYSFMGAGIFCLVILMPTRELIEAAQKANEEARNRRRDSESAD